jgi:HAD superfamily hydrolase (TIGR01484 family)
MKRLIVFDLDGTLAESKAAIDQEMAGLLEHLLSVVRVAVMSGGAWPQFEKQFLSNLPQAGRLDRLSLLPTSGTRFYRYAGSWTQLYADDFSAAEKHRIIAALDRCFDESGFRPDRQWGDVIEDRGSQITLSALGQEAPLDAKRAWDPDFVKRQAMKAVLGPILPEFSIGLGGSSSIDITRRGVDKAYGIGKLHEILDVPATDMLFVGDALFPGGNDAPVRTTGVTCIQVSGPEETKRVIETVIACLGSV